MNAADAAVTVTPAIASQLLGRNTHNRRLSTERVNRYAEAIRRGDWCLNGEAIKVAADGTLLDGQHRLAAVVQAGRPIQALLIEGLDPVAQETMDLGGKRTLAQILELRGNANAPVLAAALGAIYTYRRWRTLQTGASYRVTPQQAIELLEGSPELPEGVTRARPLGNVIGPGLAAGLTQLFADAADLDFAAEFGREVAGDVTGLAVDNPLRQLRLRADRLGNRSGRVEMGAVTIKAWNAWVQGRPVAQLKWSPARGEGFPLIHDYPPALYLDRQPRVAVVA